MVGVEELDAHTWCGRFMQALVTYKGPRNNAAKCPFLKKDLTDPPRTSRQREKKLFQILILERVNAPSFPQAFENRILSS